MKDDCPVDCTNRSKFVVDILGLQQLTGQERVNRSRKLFPTRWVPELGPEGLGTDVIPSGPRSKKRKAEAPPTEQPINSGATPAASPRKRVRVISFAEPPRKSGRMAKTKVPEAHTREDGDAAIPPRNNTKASKLRSALKKTNTPVENAVTAKAKTQLMATAIAPSPPDGPARSKRGLSKKKADAALPSSSFTIPPKPSSLTLVTPNLQCRSGSSKSGSPESSTAVSPVSGDSRGSCTSSGTAVESPEVELNKVNGKRKRVDGPEDIDSKVGETLTESQVETIVMPRRTTRTRPTKLTAKAAAAISNTQPVEAKCLNRKRRKMADSPQKKGKV
ncbi:hypothetical protein PILCRDRAFT_109062 [Piloderma croceum F 1598]|uniref:Uncharacterized protein n=1 Tax=Piloderma croceum (strain F 1598) TaxID=765440 RepID=A0A0C3BZQ7_PILCF|nr:hypothetical protein PILCRDRAFT_109062 [Piloderma croceum F 1598]